MTKAQFSLEAALAAINEVQHEWCEYGDEHAAFIIGKAREAAHHLEQFAVHFSQEGGRSK